MKILKVERIGGTFLLYVVNFRRKTMFRYYFQFSFKKPWLLPGFQKNYENLGFDLYGWLFFYFGKEYTGLLYETTDKETVLKDKKGKSYYLFGLESYGEKMLIREHLKARHAFFIEKKGDTLHLSIEA